MANFVRHTPCEKCGSRDNRAEYDDGSSWCFGCGDYTAPYITTQIDKPQQGEKKSKTIPLPSDIEVYYPQIAVDWFKKCGLGLEDMYVLKCLWSEYRQWLIFPIHGESGSIAAWQARSFQKDLKGRKYFSQGDIHNVVHIFDKGSKTLVLTEGIMDAYKVVKTANVSSMPIFGSHISSQMAKRLLLLGKEDLTIWLDSDKIQEAISFKRMLETSGFSSIRIIYTEKDPKNCDNICEVINNG